MTSNNAAVETLMCARNGSRPAPRSRAQAIPTREPRRRLRTFAFFYEMNRGTEVARKEEIMKNVEGLLRN
jgi:hypothetical protein